MLPIKAPSDGIGQRELLDFDDYDSFSDGSFNSSYQITLGVFIPLVCVALIIAFCWMCHIMRSARNAFARASGATHDRLIEDYNNIAEPRSIVWQPAVHRHQMNAMVAAPRPSTSNLQPECTPLLAEDQLNGNDMLEPFIEDRAPIQKSAELIFSAENLEEKVDAVKDYVEVDEVSGLQKQESYPFKDHSTGIPQLFICPITQDVMEDPVMASDGYNYERAAVLEWFKSHHTSPMTNLPLLEKLVITNHSLKSTIVEWKQKHRLPR